MFLPSVSKLSILPKLVIPIISAIQIVWGEVKEKIGLFPKPIFLPSYSWRKWQYFTYFIQLLIDFYRNNWATFILFLKIYSRHIYFPCCLMKVPGWWHIYFLGRLRMITGWLHIFPRQTDDVSRLMACLFLRSPDDLSRSMKPLAELLYRINTLVMLEPETVQAPCRAIKNIIRGKSQPFSILPGPKLNQPPACLRVPENYSLIITPTDDGFAVRSYGQAKDPTIMPF